MGGPLPLSVRLRGRGAREPHRGAQLKPGALRAFWQGRADALAADPIARAGIVRFHRSAWGAPPAQNEEAAFAETLATLIEEAELAATLLAGHERRTPVLEVGGGVGLLHAFLRAEGLDAHALEPSEAGFDGSWETGVAVLRATGVDATRWHRLAATDADKDGRLFGLVFSHNLLEHVGDLGATLSGLSAALAPDGIMIHHTVNYVVPYEPHFRIPLVPGAPRLTALFYPGIAKSPVWKGLNFVTPGAVQRACHAAGLEAAFAPGMIARSLDRLETDPLFRSRHGAFLPLWRALKAAGLARAFERLPSGLATPLRFTARRSKAAHAVPGVRS